MQDDARSLGVHPEIEFAARRHGELGIVRLRVDAAAHEDEFFRERRKFRIGGLGDGEIGERATFVNGDLVRIFVDHAEQELRDVFGGRFRAGRAFGHGRNFRGAVNGVALGEIPGALISDLAVERLPARDEFLAVDEREGGAGDDGNVGASDNFEQAQSVQDFFVAPGIARDDGDAEDFGVRRLHDGEDGLHVRAAGAGAILVDDDFAFFLGCERRGGENCEC